MELERIGELNNRNQYLEEQNENFKKQISKQETLIGIQRTKVKHNEFVFEEKNQLLNKKRCELSKLETEKNDLNKTIIDLKEKYTKDEEIYKEHKPLS